ncbi:MAG: hypothetical protein NTW21_24920 [Verrucomicrobia bacterium]|nr:hypothetical protein [Verrucomicrobiota bacterium]
MKTAILIGIAISAVLLYPVELGASEKPHLCPCGRVYNEMMRTGFSFKDKSQFYTILLKNRNKWGLYYCWHCGTQLPEREKLGDEEFPIVHDGPPVHSRPEKPKPCVCNISREALYDHYHTLSFDGKRYIMETLDGKVLGVRFCWSCGGTMPEFKEEEWSVIDFAPATKSFSGTFKEVAAGLNGLLEDCRSGTRLKPMTIFVDGEVADIRVEETCDHSNVGHAIWNAARHAGVGLKVEEKKITVHADPAAKAEAEKMRVQQEADQVTDPFAPPRSPPPEPPATEAGSDQEIDPFAPPK